MSQQKTVQALLVSLLYLSLHSFAAEQVPDTGLLKTRAHFAELERRALEQPYHGIISSEGKQQDLFTIKKTGVSTTAMVDAAQQFLASISTAQKAQLQFAIDDAQWRQWSNVDNGIYLRQGLSLAAMEPQQRSQLFALLKASLSMKGMEQVRNIMKSEHTLKELNNHSVYLDELLYFITVMGIPSVSAPWGWQFEGHHLVINYFVLGSQVVMTPVFMGAEPVVAKSGKYQGNVVLQQEQDLAIELMQALTPKQQQQAIIAQKGKTNMVAAANSDNLQLDYQGIKVSRFNQQQRKMLIGLIDEYISNINVGHAQVKMAEVKQHLADTWFAWAGDVDDHGVFYYRIHSPVVLIEFDHQAPIAVPSKDGKDTATRNHIHTMIRTPNGNDYGQDFLKQHLQNHHSH